MTPAQVFAIAGGHQRQAAAQYGGGSLPQGASRDPANDMAELARLSFG